MDPTNIAKEEEVLSMDGDVVDVELNYNTDVMSDGEVLSELANLPEIDEDEMNGTVIECPVALKNMNPSNPKSSKAFKAPKK